MIIPPIPINERDRITDLYSYHILDTPAEQLFDDLAQLAAQICGVDYAIINLIDSQRHWLKAVYGLGNMHEIPREIGFCSFTVINQLLTEIPDLQLDERFCENPFVIEPPYFRFYAGMPLINNSGHALGTLVVLEGKPHHLSAWQKSALHQLATVIIGLLEARKTEHEHQLRDRRMRLMRDNSLDAQASLNADGCVVDWNQQAEVIFGWPEREAIGQRLSDLILPSRWREDPRAQVEQYLSQDNPALLKRRYEIIACRKNGEEFPLELSLSKIESGHGPLFGLSARDITERHRHEQTIRKLAMHLQSAREAERKRIANEIHDELGGVLTAMKYQLSALFSKLKPQDSEVFEIHKTSNLLLDTAINSLRRIIDEIRPSILDEIGLWAALEWQTHEFEVRTGIHAVFTSNEKEPPVSPDLATVVFRIYQELLNNIDKHASASAMEAKASTSRNWIALQVKDNGKGFSKDRLIDSQSHGISAIVETARHLGGRTRFAMTPGGGTKVVILLPLT